MTRPDWDDYFMGLATLVATRATCDRKHVGAVIVKDKQIIATGYNGAPSGMPHCDSVGHELVDMGGRMSCIRTLHAESNALDRAGSLSEGASLYCTALPCYECAKRIINAKIETVFYKEYYESRSTELVLNYFCDSPNARIYQLKETKPALTSVATSDASPDAKPLR